MPTLPFRKDGDPYGGSLRDGSRVVSQTGNLIEDVSSHPDFAVAPDHRPRVQCTARLRRDRWCFSMMCLPSDVYTTYWGGLAHQAELRSILSSHRLRWVASATDSKLMERCGRATFRPQANRGRSNVGDDMRRLRA
jgi:hypothetical protein